MAAPSVPVKLYPRLTPGRFNNWRIAAVVLTQLFFFGMPWLEWNGRQAVLFDLAHARFLVFGLTLWPQDFVYLAALLIACAFALFLWTTLAGRLWCGYACPQTVYTQVLLWIERYTEGDHVARRKLDAAPWGPAKLARKALRHGLSVLFCLGVGFSFVAWFTPARELAAALLTLSLGVWDAFWMLSYAGFTWLMADGLRESVCKHICPYARFQGVMFDPDTLVISYDARRGEPRRQGGDCVGCGICVQVCPVGIDIRAGLQYECIGCAACIDACDKVMDKIGSPRGLIRHTSQNALSGGSARSPWRRPRVWVYGSLVAGVAALTLGSLLLRTPFQVDVIRDRAALVRETPEGWLENAYTLRITNGHEATAHYRLDVEGLDNARLVHDGHIVTVPPLGSVSVPVRVQAAPDAVARGSQPIRFVIDDGDGRLLREKSSFIGE